MVRRTDRLSDEPPRRADTTTPQTSECNHGPPSHGTKTADGRVLPFFRGELSRVQISVCSIFIERDLVLRVKA